MDGKMCDGMDGEMCEGMDGEMCEGMDGEVCEPRWFGLGHTTHTHTQTHTHIHTHTHVQRTTYCDDGFLYYIVAGVMGGAIAIAILLAAAVPI